MNHNLVDDIIKTNDLFKEAVTHTSYANEEGVNSYERLEFLGDAVFDLIISEYLYLKTTESEGVMTKKRANYVCEQALYEYSLAIGLDKHLKLGKGELDSNRRQKKAIIADMFESFIGALFLVDGLGAVKNFVYNNIIPLIENNKISFSDDYKSNLQELVQTDRRSLEYVVVKEEGPSHNKTFTVEVKIDDVIYGQGIAHTKKEAEQLAAKDALNKSVTK